MSTTPSPPTSPSSPVSPSIQSSHDPLSNPEDSTCELRFLMVNGESFRLVLPATASVYQVKQRVIETRPKELVDFLRSSTPSVSSGPSKEEEIRILHLGKFLDDPKTLKECHFATGKDNLTTVHIAVKVTAQTSDEMKEKVNKKAAGCCAVM